MNLSRYVSWLLLAPEPKEDQRGRGRMWVLLAFGAFFALLGVIGLFLSPPEFEDALQQWALALVFLVQALLCSPSLYERPRAVLGVRAAASVAGFAVIGMFAPAFISRGYWLGMALVAASVPILLCLNYFSNRRRAPHSRPAA